MRKILTMAVAVLLVAGMTPGPALAQAGNFKTTSASVNSSGALVVSWDEAGLGNGGADGLVHYTLTADGSATYACLNKPGKHPQASNKESVNGPLSTNGQFAPGKNGRVQASLTVGPVASNLTCPSGQTFVLADVTYSNIVLTDTTNGTAVNVAGTGKVVFFVI